MIKTTIVLCIELVVIVSLMMSGCIAPGTPSGNTTTPNATPITTPTPEATPTPTPEPTPTPTPANNTTDNNTTGSQSAADLYKLGFYGRGGNSGNRGGDEPIPPVPETATVIMVGCGLLPLALRCKRKHD